MENCTPPTDEEELDEPVKVRWRENTKLRSRLQERYAAYAAEEDGEQPERFLRTVSRQKTNVVAKTVEEAEAVVKALEKFHGPGYQRAVTWATGSMAKSAGRVSEEMKKAIHE